jgi:hypothetical protein
MGLGLGALITQSLIYSGITGSLSSSVAEYYARQQTPAVRVVYPPTIALLVALLVALVLAAATVMAWRVSRRISGATLRFDDD